MSHSVSLAGTATRVCPIAVYYTIALRRGVLLASGLPRNVTHIAVWLQSAVKYTSAECHCFPRITSCSSARNQRGPGRKATSGFQVSVTISGGFPKGWTIARIHGWPNNGKIT